jgi:hypothetical protein
VNGVTKESLSEQSSTAPLHTEGAVGDSDLRLRSLRQEGRCSVHVDPFQSQVSPRTGTPERSAPIDVAAVGDLGDEDEVFGIVH